MNALRAAHAPPLMKCLTAPNKKFAGPFAWFLKSFAIGLGKFQRYGWVFLR